MTSSSPPTLRSSNLRRSPTPTPRLAPSKHDPEPCPPTVVAPSPRDQIQALLALARRRPVPLEAACRLLSLSAGALRELVEHARKNGYDLALVHDQLVRAPRPPEEQVRDLPAKPSGPRFVVGVLSDTHLGSLSCRRESLAAFVRLAYRKGARHILHAGDVLDGCYRHGLFELSHSGLDAQTRDLFETLPRLAGLTYHAIGGNRRGNGQWAMGNSQTGATVVDPSIALVAFR